jgi:UDP:flavonoid glycosyltransferase YjiC (YdhE family)
MLNETGHLIPTYTLAGKLKKNACFNIVYVAGNDQKKEITQQGFQFEHDFDFEAVRRIPAGNHSSPFKRIITIIRHRFTDVKKNNVKFVGFCRLLLQKYKPSLIFVDDLHLHYRIALHDCNIPFIPLSIVLLSHKEATVPPPNSALLPDNTSKKKLFINIEWMVSLAYLNLKELYYAIRFNGYDYHHRSLARHVNYPYEKRITFQQFYGPGEKNIDKIIMCPPYFDFPRMARPDVHYIESCVDMDRALCGTFNWNEIKNNTGVVLCTLGTQAHKHRTQCEKFIRNLITVFRQKTDYSLIIALGKITDGSSFGPLPGNVYTYETVPQMEVLARSLFMITHGGLGTIKECICMAVPMLVYPVNPHCDQFGNAARVVYHGIGARGSLRGDDCRAIGNNVDHMLENKQFKTTILKMRDKFASFDKNEAFMNFINARYSIKSHEPLSEPCAMYQHA